ncbi:ATP-binding cassette domain-containing protein [Mordavella massiliensis]|uniref:ABC transporter ATP-binding protein n=1 Tax=Mordavella massiliensis TaxID=1871024 RepID=UPI00210C31EA|nr:ABC transporter ATP-binding protein [Mordavella massiliensis]
MLKLENVTKHYDRFTLNCSLHVEPGCITGLVGQNGAGKSTTFKAVLGLIRPDGGKITIMGKDAASLTMKDRQKIGVVLSNSGISGYLTVKDTAAMLSGFYPDFDKEKFLESCRKCRLPEKKKIKEFSTGMKAKLKLLIALSHSTDLLLLDEPTAGLDVVARDELLDMLREYMEEDENRSILISSHISTDLEGICDDLYMISDGKIIFHEDTDILLSRYAVLKVDHKEFSQMDKQYILRVKKENFGYSALTDQKQFYAENYPKAVIENSGIDDVIMMMIQGEEL